MTDFRKVLDEAEAEKAAKDKASRDAADAKRQDEVDRYRAAVTPIAAVADPVFARAIAELKAAGVKGAVTDVKKPNQGPGRRLLLTSEYNSASAEVQITAHGKAQVTTSVIVGRHHTKDRPLVSVLELSALNAAAVEPLVEEALRGLAKYGHISSRK